MDPFHRLLPSVSAWGHLDFQEVGAPDPARIHLVRGHTGPAGGSFGWADLGCSRRTVHRSPDIPRCRSRHTRSRSPPDTDHTVDDRAGVVVGLLLWVARQGRCRAAAAADPDRM